ncbi:MAG: hypothetical protein IPG04_42120 [Polyangiaceae bacterium]|nr:hypothetical protein [Polyangiaceae bacterium]
MNGTSCFASRFSAVVAAALLACSSSGSEPAPSAKALSASVSTTAGKSSASAPATPSSAPVGSAAAPPAPPPDSPRGEYQPLPKITACDACRRPGTGCVEGTTATCALDPGAWWSIEVDRHKGTPVAESMPVCLFGACGTLGDKKEAGWVVLSDLKGATVTTAVLLGLDPFEVDDLRVSALQGPLKIDDAFFDKGVAGIDSTGQELRLKLKLGQSPASARKPLQTLSPKKTTLAEKHASAFAKAEEIARLAASIDAKISAYRRVPGHTYRASGFGIPLMGFYDGSTLVKVAAILPYTPPTIMATYYFDKGRLVLERAHANDAFNDKGEQYEMLTTSFYDGDKPIWADTPEFDPAKAEPRDTKKVAEDLDKALKDPKHRVDAI